MAVVTLPQAFNNDFLRSVEANFSVILSRLASLETGVRTVAPVDLVLPGSGNAPSATTLGSSPAVAGYLFDATTERVTLSFTVPPRWKKEAKDNRMRVRLWCHLNTSQSAGDTIAFVADYVTVRANDDDLADGSGGNATQTSTQITASTDVQSGATSTGAAYTVTFILDPDDADNGWNALDGYAIHIAVGRSSVGGSGNASGVVVTHADLIYQASNRG